MKTNSTIEKIAKIASYIILAIGLFIGLSFIKVMINHGGSINLIIGIGVAVSTFIFWLTLNLIINISLKLNKLNDLDKRVKVELSENSITDLQRVIQFKQEEKGQKPKTIPAEVITPTPVQPIIRKSENYDLVDQIENTVLGEVLSGNKIEARHILMTKLGMTLSDADKKITELDNLGKSDS